MSRLFYVFSLVVVGAIGMGCAGTAATFGTTAFMHGEYPYEVEYRDPKRQVFISSDWRLDNFYGAKGKLKPKEGSEYETTMRFDANGDGTYERDQKLFIYDLSFEHVKRDQEIWLRTVPIDSSDANKNLDVIARDYVSAIAGAGYAYVSLSDKSVSVVEKRYATKIVGQQALQMAGRDALLVVIDVSNVDQLAVNSQDSNRRAALLFVRTGYEHFVTDKASFPVIMVLGYASHPTDFDEGMQAFEYFASRITLYEGKTRKRPLTRQLEEEKVRALPSAKLALSGGTVARLSAPPAAAPAPAPAQPAPAQPAPAASDAALPPPAAPAPAAAPQAVPAS